MQVQFQVKHASSGMSFGVGDVAEIPEPLARKLIESRQAQPFVADESPAGGEAAVVSNGRSRRRSNPGINAPDQETV